MPPRAPLALGGLLAALVLAGCTGQLTRDDSGYPRCHDRPTASSEYFDFRVGRCVVPGADDLYLLYTYSTLRELAAEAEPILVRITFAGQGVHRDRLDDVLVPLRGGMTGGAAVILAVDGDTVGFHTHRTFVPSIPVTGLRAALDSPPLDEQILTELEPPDELRSFIGPIDPPTLTPDRYSVTSLFVTASPRAFADFLEAHHLVIDEFLPQDAPFIFPTDRPGFFPEELGL